MFFFLSSIYFSSITFEFISRWNYVHIYFRSCTKPERNKGGTLNTSAVFNDFNYVGSPRRGEKALQAWLKALCCKMRRSDYTRNTAVISGLMLPITRIFHLTPYKDEQLESSWYPDLSSRLELCSGYAILCPFNIEPLQTILTPWKFS